MINKRYLKYTLLLFTFGMTACSDFLDEVNHSSQSADKYYQTKGGYESLIVGCYSNLKNIYNTTTYQIFTQQGTDVFTQNYPTEVAAMNQYTTTYQSNNGTIYAMWSSYFNALNNVNAAIDRSESVILKTDDPDGIEPSALAQLVAEAKALRAWYLFEIVRNWGQGPLKINESKEPSYTVEYSNGAAFYQQIFTDLEEAISVLPWRQTGSNYGRMSKAAAKHIRALAYLTRGYEEYADPKDFENAFKDAEDVYLNSGHKLLDDYAMVHRQSNEINDEIIFPIGFADGANYNTNIWNQWYMMPYAIGGWLGLGKDSYYGNASMHVEAIPTKFAYMMYDWQKDRRPSVTFMSPLNGNASTSTDGKDAGKNWFQCTTPVDGVFAKGDKIIYFPVPTDPEYKYWAETDKNGVRYKVFNYPMGDDTNWANDDYYKHAYQTTNATSRTCLPIWKFKDGNAEYREDESGSGTRDIYLFRLAETCLIAAEAAVMNNDQSNAEKYINYVVSRAEKHSPQGGLSRYSNVTIDNILDERAKELLGEGSRWNDLQRTGKLAERVLKYNWDVSNIYGGTIKTTLTQESFENKFKLRPIPLQWLNSLSNGHELGNNPGW